MLRRGGGGSLGVGSFWRAGEVVSFALLAAEYYFALHPSMEGKDEGPLSFQRSPPAPR